MNDRELIMEIFKRLDDKFFDLNDPMVAETDSKEAAEALEETLFNIGLDCMYTRTNKIDNKGNWITRFEVKTETMVKNATLISYWDGGIRIETSCKVNTGTKEVFDIEQANVEDLENCEGQQIDIGDEYLYEVFQKDEAEKGEYWYE